MMKIAFFIKSLWKPWGTERVTTVIAGELARSGMQVDIISVHSGDPFFELDPRVGIVTLTDEGDSRLRQHYLQYTAKLRRILMQNKYDYLIDVCTEMSLMSIPAAVELRTKIISWEHFNSLTNSNHTDSIVRRAVSHLAHRVVVLTESDKNNFERRFGARNVVVIPNPVTIDTSGGPSPLASKLMLAVGRLAPQKGFDLLLDAWAKTQCRHNGWKLRIVGSGDMEHTLREQIESLGIAADAEIAPPVRDMAELYREASVFVLSSRFEGFALVLTEAAAMGLPIVSFDCRCGPSDIIEAGKTGILVPPEDVDALAAAMDEMAADEQKRKSMGAAALKRSRLFAPEHITAQWTELLKSMIS